MIFKEIYSKFNIIQRFSIAFLMIIIFIMGIGLGILLIVVVECSILSSIPAGTVGSININFNETIFADQLNTKFNQTMDQQISRIMEFQNETK